LEALKKTKQGQKKLRVNPWLCFFWTYK